MPLVGGGGGLNFFFFFNTNHGLFVWEKCSPVAALYQNHSCSFSIHTFESIFYVIPCTHVSILDIEMERLGYYLDFDISSESMTVFKCMSGCNLAVWGLG